MIGRGKQGAVYLYEITEQDLLLDDSLPQRYRPGNVLLFTGRRGVRLGGEFAIAEDLAAAREYLEDGGAVVPTAADTADVPLPQTASGAVGVAAASGTAGVAAIPASGAVDGTPAVPAAVPGAAAASGAGAAVVPTAFHDESIRSLTEKIEQRDELLRDLAESLKAQRQDNELLLGQLERARTQLAVDELKRNEMVDDLQHVSKETYSIENTLEQVISEKSRLEQELAERITELVELNLQNDDLRKQLVAPQPTYASGGAKAAGAAGSAGGAKATGADAGVLGSANAANTGGAAEVLTMSSGKKIHILHEFPTPSKHSPTTRGVRLLMRVLRAAGVILLMVLLLICASTVATARANGISYGAALDIIIKGIGLS